MNSRILKTEKIDWQKAKWIQNQNLKEASNADIQKLKNSLKENNFVMPFHVWQDKENQIWILDGHHRQKALLELAKETQVPQNLEATFIHCETKQEAAKLVLVFSSAYAQITKTGLDDFLNLYDIDFTDIQTTISIPTIDFFDLDTNRDTTFVPEDKRKLTDTFVVPPFSIFDTKQGYWQERKKIWRAIIGDNGESRENTLRTSLSGNDPAYYRKKNKVEEKLGRKITTVEFEEKYYEPSNNVGLSSGVSLLDPVLAEIVCRWFGLPNCKTFDCFAGDTVFGYVSGYLGNEFTGIEIREEQAQLNQERVKEFGGKYICDDGQNVLKHIPQNSQDFLFSCPPYFDLEVYSDLENDASNQETYEDFIQILDNAFSAACKCLKENRFAVITVGDVRDEKGAYYCFPDDIKKIFIKNGLHFYNDIILIEPSGNGAMRAANQMKNRKVVKTHQNVLVFYKGDIAQIKNEFSKLQELENIEYESELTEI